VASLLDESETIAVERPLWDLSPSSERADALDRALRLRLVSSLNYLGEVASLDARHQAVLESITEQLKSGPVSPWVFGLYSKLLPSSQTILKRTSAKSSMTLHVPRHYPPKKGWSL